MTATSFAAGCAPGLPEAPFSGPQAGRTFTSENWSTLDAHPDAYRGSPVAFVGRVAAAFDARRSPPNLVVFAEPTATAGIAVVAFARDPGVQVGRYVSVVGKVLGQFTGAGPFSGTDVTRVLVQATSVEPTIGPPGRAPGD